MAKTAILSARKISDTPGGTTPRTPRCEALRASPGGDGPSYPRGGVIIHEH